MQASAQCLNWIALTIPLLAIEEVVFVVARLDAAQLHSISWYY